MGYCGVWSVLMHDSVMYAAWKGRVLSSTTLAFPMRPD